MIQMILIYFQTKINKKYSTTIPNDTASIPNDTAPIPTIPLAFEKEKLYVKIK